MKIIRKSNFDDEWINDLLIAEKVNIDFMENLIQCLNDVYSGADANYIFVGVADNYKLHNFKPW